MCLAPELPRPRPTLCKYLGDFQVHKDLGALESSFLDLQRLSHLAHGLDDMAGRLQAAAALCLSSPGSCTQVGPAFHRLRHLCQHGGLAALGMQPIECHLC